MSASDPVSPTWILAGPTACGKTAAALALAREVDLEIISVDSALIYRGMDIGTAKPTADELAQVPHHLIDILDPTESYSAARFVQDTHRLIAEIRARGRTPLLVGGTMLYIKALLEGLDELPPADPVIRAVLDAEMAERGSAALHADLAQVDPVTAARLAPGDTQRIQRALEVWRSTGRPLSAFHTRSSDQAPVHDAILVSLEPIDRAWLHQRIALRFEQMMAASFIDEVKRLRQRPDLHAGLPAIRCVGYRQVWEALDAGRDLDQPAVLREVVGQGIAATRQLAKRQITWLRSMPLRHVVPCDAGNPLPAIRQHLSTHR
ncbi:MAG: tRNA (adenosine(37)-N6)-dimethylallyltransferase MiaA [Aquabacterium sp.]|jgi:tRNA dimethylallyltransferase|uniref:tRNA (adenosine(37)-N6)-dimethylallyltransferase MiaA n=1 Tax=Aquabacterium sp. TaxID=1872578 RepID=UPI001B476335|nr:tRNA (adenosine(37)-N6)-dimethylallyltransferase MiaA [Aquabacterium sp.]MBP7132163.1 tRNA (adenosine(37)-N6)-dimethylallyltransferase MiaA [Aquabacterium sp.]MBP9062665.1 tRNA (adenosine(37)-N6)-dimethylallyltransferase MiaA [Aquabacterium sp.]MDQ5925923.1 tRNA dimethylallyltransferase [Pseudomonadota bacterium]